MSEQDNYFCFWQIKTMKYVYFNKYIITNLTLHYPFFLNYFIPDSFAPRPANAGSLAP